jgi:hypothetical protein
MSLLSDKIKAADRIENIIGVGLLTSFMLITYSTYYGSSLPETTSFVRGITVFSKFSVIFIAFGMFLTYIYYRQNLYEIRRNHTIQLQENQFAKTVKLLQSYYDKCPYFCSTLFYDWQIDKSKKLDKRKDDEITKTALAYVIFQNIETVIDVQGVDTSSPISWCGVFLQWLHSKEIQEVWERNYHDYDPGTTVPFINIFIDFIKTHKPPKNSKELQKYSEMLSNNPEIVRIINIS